LDHSGHVEIGSQSSHSVDDDPNSLPTINSFPVDRSPSSARPFRDQLSDRVRDTLRNEIRQQLSSQDRSQLRERFPFRNLPRQANIDTNIDSEDETEDSFNALGEAAQGDADESGRKCIDKVMMEVTTVYDEVVTCDHSYDKRCHTSYVTNYDSQQEEECEENFKKVCHIEYEPLAYNETVNVCRTPLIKDCDLEGETVCNTVYETECTTSQKVHEVEDDVTSCHTEQMTKCREVTAGYVTQQECDEWPVERCTVEKKLVRKYTPDTSCHKEPREMCAAQGCGFRDGEPVCHDKMKTIVVDNPIENCEIEPQRMCKHVTKLVPKLVAVQECVDVPKEICARSKNNPRKEKKPIIKKWCYTPSKESGLE